MANEEQRRYSKQTILPEIGLEGQEKLRAAKVLVIGAGGLGCPILQYLTAAGVGTIGIADGDKIDISNLQRQVLYTEQEIGQSKALVAESKLKLLNPNIQLNVHNSFITNENVLEILAPYDIIVDGSDNFPTRYLVNDACVILGKPLVFGAIYKFEGQVSVFNYKGGPTYRCLFPEAPGEGESPNCADIGVIATLPGMIGTIQANEVIKMIIGVGEVLSGKLLVMNTLTLENYFFNFKLIPENKQIKHLPGWQDACKTLPTISSITYDELQTCLKNNPQTQLIDVREVEEHAISNIGGINIPLSRFESEYSAIDPQQDIILYCASGTRSNHFAKQLLLKGFSKVMQLKNGINELIMN
jgi:adenylyltransferase/sulfurtransferase